MYIVVYDVELIVYNYILFYLILIVDKKNNNLDLNVKY